MARNFRGSVLAPVRCCTDTGGHLPALGQPGFLSGLPVIDGVQTQPGDRVLVKDQAVTAGNDYRFQNGVYIIPEEVREEANMPWVRDPDYNETTTDPAVLSMVRVYISEGTNNGAKFAVLTLGQGVKSPAQCRITDDLADTLADPDTYRVQAAIDVYGSQAWIDFLQSQIDTLSGQVQQLEALQLNTPHLGDFYMHQEFNLSTGDPLPLPWTTAVTAAGAPTVDFTSGASGQTTFTLKSDVTNEVQRLTLYWGDSLQLNPFLISYINNELWLACEFMVVMNNGASHANNVLSVGLCENRNAPLSMGHYFIAQVSGADDSLFIKSYDGTNTTSTDTGIDVAPTTSRILRIRFYLNYLNWSQCYVNTVESGPGTWDFAGQFDLTDLNVTDSFQPYVQVDKNSADEPSITVTSCSLHYQRLNQRILITPPYP